MPHFLASPRFGNIAVLRSYYGQILSKNSLLTDPKYIQERKAWKMQFLKIISWTALLVIPKCI